MKYQKHATGQLTPTTAPCTPRRWSKSAAAAGTGGPANQQAMPYVGIPDGTASHEPLCTPGWRRVGTRQAALQAGASPVCSGATYNAHGCMSSRDSGGDLELCCTACHSGPAVPGPCQAFSCGMHHWQDSYSQQECWAPAAIRSAGSVNCCCLMFVVLQQQEDNMQWLRPCRYEGNMQAWAAVHMLSASHLHRVEPWADFKDRCIATQLPPHQPAQGCFAGCGDTSAAPSSAASGSPNKRLHQAAGVQPATCAPPCYRQHTRGITAPARSWCSCQIHLLRPVHNPPAPHSIRQLTSLLANVLAVAGHGPCQCHLHPLYITHLCNNRALLAARPLHTIRYTDQPWPGMATPQPLTTCRAVLAALPSSAPQLYTNQHNSCAAAHVREHQQEHTSTTNTNHTTMVEPHAQLAAHHRAATRPPIALRTCWGPTKEC